MTFFRALLDLCHRLILRGLTVTHSAAGKLFHSEELPLKILGVSLLILAASPLLAGPPFQGKLLPAENTPATATPPLEDRRRALDQVFKDAWEDTMRHAPEFASMLGDKRY